LEWINVHKLLGYSTIFAYFTPQALAHDETRNVLSVYEKSNNEGISVVSIPHTLPHSIDVDSVTAHAVINDCLYRAGLDHEYVTVSDYNEVVLPRIDGTPATLPEFLTTMKSRNTAAYIFQHVMFDMTRVQPLTEQDIAKVLHVHGDHNVEINDISLTDFQLLTLTRPWHMKTPAPSGKTRSNTVYKVVGTVSADFLAPRELVPGFTERILPAFEGVLCRYELHPPKVWLTMVPYVAGSSMSHFRNKLIVSMARALQSVNEKGGP
jgi:hypothetical protein